MPLFMVYLIILYHVIISIECSEIFDPSLCLDPCKNDRLFVNGYCYCRSGTYDSGFIYPYS